MNRSRRENLAAKLAKRVPVIFAIMLTLSAGAATIFIGCAPRVLYVQSSPPPPPREVVPPRPRPLAIWIPGHWIWRSQRYVWVAGYWELRPKGRVWVPSQWVKTRRGWKWIPGHWVN